MSKVGKFRKDEKIFLLPSLNMAESDLQKKCCKIEIEKQILINEVDKVEKEVRKYLLCFQEEKERRIKAETDLMIAKLEGNAAKRKLSFIRSQHSPELLQIAFRQCSEELGHRTRRLREIENEYMNVVPRAEMERIQRRFETLSLHHQKLCHASDILQQKYKSLAESYEALQQEKDKTDTENINLRRNATPRPQWSKVSDYIEGGIQRWQEMAQGRSSDELVDVLILELLGGSLVEDMAEYLSCKGCDEGIPIFLRYEGCVQNKRLSKRDTLIMIDDIWTERVKAPSSQSTLAEFVDQYFKERYHHERIRAEWCYSFADACQRLAYEEQIQEAVYHHQVNLVNTLLEAFKKEDPKNKGIISREKVRGVVRESFPMKTEEALQEIISLVHRIASKTDHDVIKYTRLFTQYDETQQLPLSHLLIRQGREEQEEYVSQILKEIKSSAIDVSVEELRRAITIVDPYIEKYQLISYTCWVFNVKSEQELKEVPPIPIALLSARLQTGLIIRVGPRPTHKNIS